MPARTSLESPTYQLTVTTRERIVYVRNHPTLIAAIEEITSHDKWLHPGDTALICGPGKQITFVKR